MYTYATLCIRWWSVLGEWYAHSAPPAHGLLDERRRYALPPILIKISIKHRC